MTLPLHLSYPSSFKYQASILILLYFCTYLNSNHRIRISKFENAFSFMFLEVRGLCGHWRGGQYHIKLHGGFCCIDKRAVETKSPVHLFNTTFAKPSQSLCNFTATCKEWSQQMCCVKCFPWLMEFVNGISPLSSSTVDQPALHKSVLVTKTTTCTHHTNTTDVMCIMSCLDVSEITLPSCTV